MAQSLPNITGIINAAGAIAWQTPTGPFWLGGVNAMLAQNHPTAQQYGTLMQFSLNKANKIYQENANVVPLSCKDMFYIKL